VQGGLTSDCHRFRKALDKADFSCHISCSRLRIAVNGEINDEVTTTLVIHSEAFALPQFELRDLAAPPR
jgi:hypothetical protein